MKCLRTLCTAAIVALGIGLDPALAQPVGTVCYDLTLSVAEGGSVQIGKTVTWTITARASTADHMGLALGIVDLRQDVTNPGPINLVSGTCPANMIDFNLPRGIANRGPSSSVSGYGGTPVPDTGAPVGWNKLVQIGGAQNNLGVVGIAGFAQDVAVESGIAQIPAGRVLARGTFVAPNRTGRYCLRLANPIANVLTDVQPAPGLSRTAESAASLCDGLVCFNVVRGTCLAEINRDGIVNVDDLFLFIELMLSPPAADDPRRNADAPDGGSAGVGIDGPPDLRGRADFDGDGSVTGLDLAEFIAEYLYCVTTSTIPLP